MGRSSAALTAAGMWMLAAGPGQPASAQAQRAEVLWKYEIGSEIWAPLGYQGGRLFLGADDSTFYAIDVESRDVAWTFGTGDVVRSGAAFAAGRVLFASDDGFLYALDADSGAEAWRFDLGSSGFERVLPATDPPYRYDYLHSSPVIHRGMVVVGSADGALYAVDLETGEQLWRFETDGPVRSTPAIDGDHVYFGSWDGHVYAVSAEDGSMVWRFDTGNIIQGSPAVGDGKVYVGSRAAAVFAIDAETGESVWKHVHEDGSWVESSPVLAGGVLYIGSSDALALFALDTGSGRAIWRYETGGWAWSTPVLSGGAVYVGGISASPYYFPDVELTAGFHAVDRDSGRRLWGFEPEPIEGYITAGVFSSPVSADGVVYVAGLDGRLYAVAE